MSKTKGGTASYYSNDLLGNLWTRDGSSKSQLTYEDTTGFGTPTAGGAGGSVFGYGGGNGCQTEADTGIILMGHRYYDTRIGRFLSQDHAKSGGNWYAYAGNNPINKIDPLGLAPMDGPGSSPEGSPGYGGVADGMGYAANFADEENSRGNYNQQLDVDRSISKQIETALSEWMPQTSNSGTTIVCWDWTDPLGSAGDLSHLIDPYLPDGSLKTTLDQIGYIGAISGAVKIAGASSEESLELLGQGWNLFTTSQCSGGLIPLGAGAMLRGAGMFGLAAFGTAAAIAGTAYLGYQIGTAISNMKQGNGLSVSQNIADSIWAPSAGM